MDSQPVDLIPEPKKTKTVGFSLPEPSNHEHKPELDKATSSSSSSSSSSSESLDDDDFFQLDPISLSTPMQPGPSEPANKISPSSKYSPGKLGEDETQPQFSDPGLRQSPPLHPDPKRIPSSVFARTKSTTPMEWSVASNESLFSIQMGNSSFSRDHMFLFGRSDELTNFSGSPMNSYPTPPLTPTGSSSSPSMPPIAPMSNSSSPLPPIAPINNSSSPTLPTALVNNSSSSMPPIPPPSQSAVGGDVEKEKPPATDSNIEAMKDVSKAEAEDHAADKEKPTADGMNYSHSISRQSDGSTRSFAFPILTAERTSGSIKVGPEHQRMPSAQLEQHNSPTEVTSKAPPQTEAKGWFSCFTCCPFCR